MNKKIIGFGVAALALAFMMQKPAAKKSNFLYLEVDEILPDRDSAGGDDTDAPTGPGGSGGTSGGSGGPNNAPMAGYKKSWVNSL